MRRGHHSHGSRSVREPLIALLTDFGLRDHYVGTMKGVIATLCPHARIVDISHDVSPQQVSQAGYLLWASYRFFPPGTLFVAVVDPGVGTARRILVVRSQGYTFLAPDNGLLDYVLSEDDSFIGYEIQDREIRRFGLPYVSATFHGRDLFAPLAAHVAKGGTRATFGMKVGLPSPQERFIRKRGDATKPTILHIDHFGNIVSNVRAQSFDDISKVLQTMTIGRTKVSRWVRIFASAPDATPCLMLGSSNLVEVIMKNGSAASILNANLESTVRVFWQ